MSRVPKVSVIIPAYNVSKYIKEALASLEAQTFIDFEALIVDDGSTDDTPTVVQKFCQRDSRFKLLQKSNGGLSSARNYGMRHAQGEYIALLDGDDTYHKDKLATHIARLYHKNDIGVVYSASRAIRDDGKPTFITLSGKPVRSNTLIALLCKNFVGHGSNAVFRRCLIDEVGDFDENLRSWEDVDFWLRIAALQKWRFYREKRILCNYRVRPSGLSFNTVQMQISGEQVIKAAYQRSPDLIEPMLPTAYAYMYRYLARLCLQSGDIKPAGDFIEQALNYDKSIFYRDIRALLTLISVGLSPLAKLVIGASLGKNKILSSKN
ncbi:glycosyltransferase family A protein [Mastigocoleus sp. MO_188.B34]|uniref:glycosyltransferase family 2 protein n=1 Tax=Mastigocoleus sp. MO_188.B34 TaxID=3036635 RepID=UPI00262346DB|nr:glycosyltransferase family A protein [Mastigocoleus sp. MO_188.B34]MDJ0696981.1 glycosyltransferase family A protein [Mastigocoleus sp. MO_188.B34]